jgi:hypothetical protein
MAQKDRFSQGLWGQDAVAVQGRGAGEKTVLFSHSYIKTMILPRQARDKHRESTQKKDPASCRASSTLTDGSSQVY